MSQPFDRPRLSCAALAWGLAFAFALLPRPASGGVPVPPDGRRILFLAGPRSHGEGSHEHAAGCALLREGLACVPGVRAAVEPAGWPADEAAAFAGLDALVVYCDGEGGHVLLEGDRLRRIDGLMARGVGLALLHYAVNPFKDRGQAEFIRWIGGCYETGWSVDPAWEADFAILPVHPVTRGVRPFRIFDEWYYHMRFVAGMKGVTPILSVLPPVSTLRRPDGPHSGNPAVRAAVARGELQHVAWVFERSGGGRGFGFTGGHLHENWSQPDFRRVVLNAILWIAHLEVPENGVPDRLVRASVPLR